MIYANAYAFSCVSHTPGLESFSERFTKTRHDVTYRSFDNGPVLGLWGNSNWEVEDCDLFGTYATISTGTSAGLPAQSGPGARYGRIANSVIKYGDGVAIMADSAKELIIEGNSFHGKSMVSMQMADISTYEDVGYAQHIYLAHNSFEGTQGGDREGLNFDALNGGSASYDGEVLSADGLWLNLSGSVPEPLPDGGWGPVRKVQPTLGGAVTAVDGNGKGQYRRLVAVSPDGRSVQIHRPFDGTLQAARVLITPYKGQVIYDTNSFKDTVSVQSYGLAFDVIFARTRFLRAGPLASTATTLGPNLHIEMLGNDFLCGNRLSEWGISFSYKFPVKPSIGDMISAQIAVAGSGSRGFTLTHFMSVRNNVIRSNGGILVAGDTEQVVFERNTAWLSRSECVRLNDSVRSAYLRENTCSEDVMPELDESHALRRTANVYGQTDSPMMYA